MTGLDRPTFESYAQNGEDVVLFRAVGHIERGRYIDVGAYDPVESSISYAFYLRGWRGVTVEPVHAMAELHRQLRPEDLLIEAAISDKPGLVPFHEIEGTGLSTLDDELAQAHRDRGFEVRNVEVNAVRLDTVLDQAGWEGQDIHFMTIDTEGTETAILSSVDLRRWRPWIIAVEATTLLNAGYEFCLFDGLSRFYLATERADALREALQAPANVLDNYTTKMQRDLWMRNAALEGQTTELSAENIRLTEQGTNLTERNAELAERNAELAERNAELDEDAHLLQLDVQRWRKLALEGRRPSQAGAQNGDADGLPQLQLEHQELLRRHHELSQNHHQLSQDHHQLSQDHHRVSQEITAIHSSFLWRLVNKLNARHQRPSPRS